MPDPPIKIIPTTYEGSMALVRSDAVRTVEQAIAGAVGMRIVDDNLSVTLNFIRADMSVSALSMAEIEELLTRCSQEIIAFGIAFYRSQNPSQVDIGEFPEGVEPGEDDKPVTVEVRGLGAGFAINYAIFYNFVVNRTPAELKACLKNRRIPGVPKLAKEMRQALEASRGSG